MNPLAISVLACVLMLIGAVAGVRLRRTLPNHHLDANTKEIVRLGAGLIATISALVLGLLINSANRTFDAKRQEVERIAADLVLLDHLLERYGPEARDIRLLMRRGVEELVQRTWRGYDESADAEPFAPGEVGVQAFASLNGLSGATPVQHALRSQALQVAIDVARSRLTLFERARSPLPWPVVAILMFWFTVLFASFCLFTPVNPTGGAALVAIALSVSAALFLFLEMGQAFSGFIQISRHTLSEILPAV